MDRFNAMNDLFEQHSEVLDRFEDEENIDERDAETVDQVLHVSLHFVAALVEWAANARGIPGKCLAQVLRAQPQFI